MPGMYGGPRGPHSFMSRENATIKFINTDFSTDAHDSLSDKIYAAIGDGTGYSDGSCFSGMTDYSVYNKEEYEVYDPNMDHGPGRGNHGEKYVSYYLAKWIGEYHDDLIRPKDFSVVQNKDGSILISYWSQGSTNCEAMSGMIRDILNHCIVDPNIKITIKVGSRDYGLMKEYKYQ